MGKDRMTVPFNEATVEYLDSQLSTINAVIPCQWGYSDRCDQLIIQFEQELDGPDSSRVTLTNWKAAKAFVDALLFGYNLGFGAGRNS